MKVDMYSKTDATGTTKYWVYVDGIAKECFSDRNDAIEYFESIDASKVKEMLLMTKEV